MPLLDFLFPKKAESSASTAKDRLQIIIARNRSSGTEDDFVPKMHEELMQVIAKYIKIDVQDVKINRETRDGVDVLDVNITIPNAVPGK